MTAHEVNFDGLVGARTIMPGYRFGNMSIDPPPFSGVESSSGGRSRAAKDESFGGCHGFPEAVIRRMSGLFIPALRQLGFTGSDEQILDKVASGRAGFQREFRVANVEFGMRRRFAHRQTRWTGKFT